MLTWIPTAAADEPPRVASAMVRNGDGPGAHAFAVRTALRDAVDQALTEGPFDPIPLGEVRDGPASWTAPFTVATCPDRRLVLPRDIAAAMPATVTITSKAGSGTGVVVSADGIVLTAAHVLEDDSPLEIVFADGAKHPATVVRVDHYQDVAVLDIAGDGHPCVRAALAPPGIGTELFVVGSPLGRELSQSVSKGIVSGMRTVEGWRFLQTDAPINPGNSGGPLLDLEGRVIAIVDWKVRGAEGLGFGVPIDVVTDRLGLVWGGATDAAPSGGSRGRIAVVAR